MCKKIGVAFFVCHLPNNNTVCIQCYNSPTNIYNIQRMIQYCFGHYPHVLFVNGESSTVVSESSISVHTRASCVAHALVVVLATIPQCSPMTASRSVRVVIHCHCT